MIAKKSAKTHGLFAKLHPDHRLRGRAVISLVEQKVQRPVDRREPGPEIIAARQMEQTRRCGKCFLGARNAFLDGRCTAEKRIRDFPDTEAAQDVEYERNLSLLGKPRVD